MKAIRQFTVFFGFMLLWLTFALRGLTQGNLLLFPKRVVFENAMRSQEIILQNTGTDTATYNISFTQIRMTGNGSFEKITQADSGQKFASENLRFYPRQVILAPKQTQVVKVQLVNINNLEPGEYRSHLFFRGVPVEKPLGETPAVKDSAISIKLVPIFGISIPIIIRKGASTTEASISDFVLLKERDTMPIVTFTINRTGNMSLYGDLWIDHISTSGKVFRVGAITGLAVYTPNLNRDIRLSLKKDAGIDFHSGKLHLVFFDKAIQQNAQQEISLY